MKTLFIVKPDGLTFLSEILKIFNEKNINLLTLKTEHISVEKAEALYGEHKGRYFYDGLMQYITAKPCLAAMIDGDVQKISEAKESIRRFIKDSHAKQDFSDESFKAEYLSTFDGVHCSDPTSAQREMDLFFNRNEVLLQDINKDNKQAIVAQKLKDKDMPTQQLHNLSLFKK